MTVNEPTIRFKIVIPNEWSNKEKGKFWEDVSADLFPKYVWEVTQNIEFAGMQTDIYVQKLDTNEKALIECKFQKRFIEAPTIYKLMGQALFKKVDSAYLLSTSDLNAKAKGVFLEYQKEQNKSYKPYDLVIWSGDKLAKKFMDVHCIEVPEIDQISGCVKTITLLLTHNKEFFWVAEEMGESNIPCRAIIFQTPKSKSYWSSEKWKKYFSLHKIWENLEITVNPIVIEAKDNLTNQSISEIPKVTVSIINQADGFDDYHRPSRPEDFFGRLEPQREFWDFVNNVRDEKTDLRVVSFSGSTGLGKSSLVLKLASDCRQKPEYKDNFYIYHVDVTSVNQEKATLFVIAAIRQALQKAIDDGFVDLPNHQVSIESVESNYFSSESIQLLIKTLKNSRKVIVIFFDQFEEILTRDSLSYLYDLFKQAAYDVDSLKENIVLGFCWRTDVNLPTTNPAYFTWHNLAKVRKDIYFSEFSQQDSSNLLDGFKKYLNSNQKGSRLQPSIKKWLLDNCKNQPWLLKRFCGDIYNQNLSISELDSKRKKVITKFDIKIIFDKDIQRANVTLEHNTCLSYIAKCSPVSKMDVCSKFNDDVINSLLKSKLVIETGQNYKIYWDMFREYLLDGKLPEMIISYRPRTKISTAWTIFRLLNQYKTISELASVSKYRDGVVVNAILDLQKFFEVTKDERGKIIVLETFIKLQDQEIAEELAELIQNHVIIKKIYEQHKPGELMWLSEFQNLLSEQYNVNPATAADYASKMLSWFHFAGLLEERNGKIVRPNNPKQGKQKGKLEKCEPQYAKQPQSTLGEGQLPLFDTSSYRSRYDD
ncbi:hypothetical protein CP500_002260 [Tychonema bourrellyi FEM_GT703]|uniref:Restriction endonuclease type IV Mrr domain-containing protein n=1 Tax=Tychonema bourrellyi FEM_GT703 TaxID=2040638 RepID=A0A2G4F5Q0_9CYAN|nr:restriction endonuclease [Tychonema bourrellyi]PHX57031.1 hypothetical protein CP500_002260 [Tychonema bourrellyi FEM_GT703]